MENKISIKKVFNKSMSYLKHNWQKAFISSLLQFGVFAVVFLLTNSVLLSVFSWLVFLPTQTVFLANMTDEKVKLEHVFKLGQNWLTYVLMALVCTICYSAGFVLAIVPAILLFVNYAFVFDFAKENDLLASFKKSKQLSKGYKSKLLAIGLIYLFILLVLVAVSILIALLLGMILQTNHFMLYIWGAFAGLCLFLIFAAPVLSITVSNLKVDIEQDVQLKAEQQTIAELQQVDANEEEQQPQTDGAQQTQPETEGEQTEQQPLTDEPDDIDPTSYIV